MEIALLFLVGCGSGYWLDRSYRAKERVTRDEYFSVAPSTQQGAWSGISHGPLPVSTLTMPQYKCLADASYGVRIVIAPLTRLDCLQPDGCSTHAAKTVDSLVNHGFLADDELGGYTITDVGLRAREVLSVKW
jgi:hypothetical protein